MSPTAVVIVRDPLRRNVLEVARVVIVPSLDRDQGLAPNHLVDQSPVHLLDRSLPVVAERVTRGVSVVQDRPLPRGEELGQIQ